MSVSTRQERRLQELKKVVSVGDGKWKLKYTDSHTYRMQVTTTIVEDRKRLIEPRKSQSA